jgi:Zn finger protein HypA/HybF involved in hydrogenase expression
MAFKDETKKEFVCRQCTTFLNSEDLKNGNCPNCESDEYIFSNDLNDEE